MPRYNRTTVVLDLDDTLYSEREYLRSGVHYLLNSFRKWLTSDLSLSVCELINLSNPIDALFEYVDLPDSVKQSMLWMYRLHTPDIKLYPDARNLIDFCNSQSINIAIITDGRLVSQSLKLKALNLEHVKSYISEEYGDLKPSKNRFLQVQEDFPSERYIYVGDNPMKDFIAPNQLGWTTVGLSYREGNIHSYLISELSSLQKPLIWIDELSEVVQVILEDNK